MPRQPKPTPEKSCEWCGTAFTRKRVGKAQQLECVSNYMRRRFCTISCAVSNQHATPATEAASRKRAHAHVGPSCEACDTNQDLVVHHVDGDATNNALANLQTLCSPCHSFFHATQRRIERWPPGRMGRLFV